MKRTRDGATNPALKEIVHEGLSLSTTVGACCTVVRYKGKEKVSRTTTQLSGLEPYKGNQLHYLFGLVDAGTVSKAEVQYLLDDKTISQLRELHTDLSLLNEAGVTCVSDWTKVKKRVVSISDEAQPARGTIAILDAARTLFEEAEGLKIDFSAFSVQLASYNKSLPYVASRHIQQHEANMVKEAQSEVLRQTPGEKHEADLLKEACCQAEQVS